MSWYPGLSGPKARLPRRIRCWHRAHFSAHHKYAAGGRSSCSRLQIGCYLTHRGILEHIILGWHIEGSCLKCKTENAALIHGLVYFPVHGGLKHVIDKIKSAEPKPRAMTIMVHSRSLNENFIELPLGGIPPCRLPPDYFPIPVFFSAAAHAGPGCGCPRSTPLPTPFHTGSP